MKFSVLIASICFILLFGSEREVLCKDLVLEAGFLCDSSCMIHELECKKPSLKITCEKDICRFQRLVLFGPEAIEKYSRRPCKPQKRVLSGLLYPSLFFDKDLPAPFLSPLPGASILKKYGSHFVTVYSRPLGYYVQYLQKKLDLKVYCAKDIWHLESTLKKALKEKGRIFLLLPDPLFVDKRGRKILQFCLDAHPHHGKILDLLGINLPDITVIEVPFPQKEFCHALLMLLKEDFPPGIYFPEAHFEGSFKVETKN